jgi:hypothetical protein
MSEPSKNWTAAQIARARGVSHEAIAREIHRIQESRLVDVDGTAIRAWPFETVPLEWRLEITERAIKRGFKDAEDFLASLPVSPWKAPLPWDRVPPREQRKAVKLQRALATALALREQPGAEARDAEQCRLAEFKAEFGYAISARHWRRLLSRTIERDGGAENWQRLELYLDDRAFAAPKVKPEVARAESQHRELDEVIAGLENRQKPTPEDRQFLWDAAFRHFEAQGCLQADVAGSNRNQRLLKASLISYLFKAFPERTLCSTLKSLKNRFEEKLIQWRAGGRRPAALQDQRPIASGRFRNGGFAEDSKKIRNKAIQLDGNISLAHRMLRERGELSKEFCEAYPYNARQAKSAVPASVRGAITPEVDMCLPLRRGPWQARMRGPYIPRDWSSVRPGDWFNADDVTWNHYFKEQLADGRWTVLRGECLVMTDLRTGYPLGFLLIPGHYNGEHVRSLTLKVHDAVGLPRFGFYFERGVWKSRLVTGDNRQGTPVHWREAENGLCSHGLSMDIRHATTPRAKPIEGVFRILQERMRCIPGFVGFNERIYDAEQFQAVKARAQRGDAEALTKFPTSAEWAAKISAVLQDFAHDPQNGKMLDGKAPAEAWSDEIRARPLRKLAAESRYILSTHQKRLTVRQQGIMLKIRGRPHLYYNEHTGPLIGRDVLAFYNLELPELLTVSDVHRQNYFSVREVEVPAMSATPARLAQVNELRTAHMSHAKGIFGEIRHEVVSTITRDREHSEQSRELGRFHNREMERGQAEKSQWGRKARRLESALAAQGIGMAGPVRDVDEALDAIKKRKIYLDRLKAKEGQAGRTGGSA